MKKASFAVMLGFLIVWSCIGVIAVGTDKPIRFIKKPQPSSGGCQSSNGVATLRGTFESSGKVGVVVVVKSSGCGAFDQSSIKAVRAIEFEPAMKDGRAVTATKMLEYSFQRY